MNLNRNQILQAIVLIFICVFGIAAFVWGSQETEEQPPPKPRMQTRGLAPPEQGLPLVVTPDNRVAVNWSLVTLYIGVIGGVGAAAIWSHRTIMQNSVEPRIKDATDKAISALNTRSNDDMKYVHAMFKELGGEIKREFEGIRDRVDELENKMEEKYATREMVRMMEKHADETHRKFNENTRDTWEVINELKKEIRDLRK